MGQIKSELAALDYIKSISLDHYLVAAENAFKAGAEWQKEQVIDILLLAAHFVMNATPQKWDIDHYKEKFIALLKPIQDQNIKLLQD